eukprot:SM000098S25077  [mRNA]  locus=s98:64646:67548:- [translate_table: standard]
MEVTNLRAGEWEETYRPLPALFCGMFLVWASLACVWLANTWSNRRWQHNGLQWVLTCVPVLKSLVLGLSFLFWHSCLDLSTCSFWIAFGVFVSRIFFETAAFVCFLLIAHGYCVTHEQLSLADRRNIAGLASLLYLTLTGYKASVPQFAVLVLVIYCVLLGVIFQHAARNAALLREQLQQLEADGIAAMHAAVHTKYCMFRRFQAALVVMVMMEIVMHANAETATMQYWVRLLAREWAEIAVFAYIGWTFRSRQPSPFYSMIPAAAPPAQRFLPPIHKIVPVATTVGAAARLLQELKESEYRSMEYRDWHIGIPVLPDHCTVSSPPVLIVIQNPTARSPCTRRAPSSVAPAQKPAMAVPAALSDARIETLPQLLPAATAVMMTSPCQRVNCDCFDGEAAKAARSPCGVPAPLDVVMEVLGAASCRA